eukprot:TRINITY_DN45756_c0_g1_i1.p1 TRINITY_DN45756_c0_g1~~TRINITY_DN45756_c0_g1_i1.p1  ORF type:complete len:373 (-),score=61.88 TRINITY_DN45756_c0_g1_i1:104-1222(-)
MTNAASKGLNLAGLRRVRGLWKEDVRRITLAELWAPVGADDHLNLAQRTHHDIKIRLAHRLKDFLFLPYKAMADPAVRRIYDKYVNAYLLHEDLATLESEDCIAKYWLGLAHVFEENQNVTTLLGQGRRRIVRLDPSLASEFDAFLSRFFVSRIGTHLLGANFLNQVQAPSGCRKPAGVAMGVLQPTRPASFIADLANSLCERSSVNVELEGATDTSMLYIPGHMRVILREILQNAVQASKLRSEALLPNSSTMPAVQVKINRGQFGVFVTVSDKAGGIPDLQNVWNWGVEPGASTGDVEGDELEDEELDEKPSVRLPLGFGLPVARLTARYFGGDLRLQSLLGYGTNVYIHMPELQRQGSLGADASSGSFG